MIDISHKHARRLLRISIDSQLPNEQWTMLQAHLETCEECRIYGERLGGLERSLKRALRMGWESTPGPKGNLSGYILVYREIRAIRRKKMRPAAVVLALVTAFVLLGGPAWIRARLSPPQISVTGVANTPAATQALAAGEPTAMPTAEAGSFPDVVAYQGRRDGKPLGDSEIYLLNPGSPPIDLTNNPAQDTDPAWSPDGEWLAFLSDRNKRFEVFVTNITGSRVMQLTDEPNVTWQGPLSWSPDGKWIALSGTRDDEGGQHWIYLVGLDGSGAHALAGSRGGESPKFSPTGDRLAYTFSDGTHQGVVINRLQTGEQVTASWEENPLIPPSALGSAFDWSLDGAGLAYVAADPNPVATSGNRSDEAPAPSGEPGSQVIAVRNLNDAVSLFDSANNNFQVASSRWPGAFRGVTWTPNGAVAYLEDLGDARANTKPSYRPEGCWTVQLNAFIYRGQFGQNNQNRPDNQSNASTFGGLCIEGGLNRSSWTPDGRWIVVQGRMPSETQFSIFAMRMPGGFGRNFGSRSRGQATPTPDNSSGGTFGPGSSPDTAAPGTILRLTSEPWSGPLPSPRPRLSGFNRTITIDPQPVKKKSSRPLVSNLSQRPGGPKGRIIYTVQNNEMSVVVSANPDGTGGQVLLATPAENRCPVWSPDGNRVALLQSSITNYPTVQNGPPVSQATATAAAATAAQRIGPRGADTTPTPAASGAHSGLQGGALSAQVILVIDSNGGNQHRVSSTDTIPQDGVLTDELSYSCPVWSPGGDYLATLVNTGRKPILAILPVNVPTSLPPDSPNLPGNANPATAQPRYIAINAPDETVNPVWSEDGSTVYLLRSPYSGAQPGMIVVNVPGDPKVPLNSSSIDLPSAVGSTTAPSMAIEPDGQTLVELEMIGLATSAHLHGIFLSQPDSTRQVGPPAYLLPQDQSNDVQTSNLKSGSVTWLYGNIFGVALNGSPQSRYKTMFFLFNLAGQNVQPLAQIEDTVNSIAWSPDGRWLIYSAESGLWGLDVVAALQGRTGPVWLSPQPVIDLNWK